MSLTLTLPPELQAALSSAADHNGVDEATFALRILTEHLNFSIASNEEALLSRIHQLSLPRTPESQQRQVWLLQESRERELTQIERQELLQLTDEGEERTAARLELLIELSHHWGKTLLDTMEQVGLSSHESSPAQ